MLIPLSAAFIGAVFSFFLGRSMVIVIVGQTIQVEFIAAAIGLIIGFSVASHISTVLNNRI